MWLRQTRQLTPPGRVDIHRQLRQRWLADIAAAGLRLAEIARALELLKLEDDIEEEEDEA
jgi:hypothetical protein